MKFFRKAVVAATFACGVGFGLLPATAASIPSVSSSATAAVADAAIVLEQVTYGKRKMRMRGDDRMMQYRGERGYSSMRRSRTGMLNRGDRMGMRRGDGMRSMNRSDRRVTPGGNPASAGGSPRASQ